MIWERTNKNPDYVFVQLKEKLLPKQKVTFTLTYSTKIPSDKFTKYGYSDTGTLKLKDWYLTPARYEDHAFVQHSNNNLDDIANAISDFDYNFYKSIWRKRILSDKQLDIKKSINNQFLNFTSYETNSHFNKINLILKWAEGNTFFDPNFVLSLKKSCQSKGVLSDNQLLSLNKILTAFKIE